MTDDGLTRRNIPRGGVVTGLVTVGAAGTAGAATGFYNPFSGYRITGTWEDHRAAGSLGGIDYGMAVGTRLPAAGGGVVTNTPYNGTGGHTVTIQHDNGRRTQYLHLSQFLLANGARIGTGAVVGLSGGAVGAPGSGSSTGPHLHWHMIDPGGTRIDPLVYLGGGGGLPKTTTEQDGILGATFRKRDQTRVTREWGYTGPVDGAPGGNTCAAVQRALRDYGYTGPVDGDPGPVDGVMGPDSWRAFARYSDQDEDD